MGTRTLGGGEYILHRETRRVCGPPTADSLLLAHVEGYEPSQGEESARGSIDFSEKRFLWPHARGLFKKDPPRSVLPKNACPLGGIVVRQKKRISSANKGGAAPGVFPTAKRGPPSLDWEAQIFYGPKRFS